MRDRKAPHRDGAGSGGRTAVLSLLFAGALVASAHAQPPPVTADDFVSAASGSNLYEVMAGHVALIESHDAKVRAYAGEMIRYHTAALDSLRQAATRSGLKPPDGGVGASQAMLLAALQSLQGPDFDQAYARQQVLAHSGALTTERGYAGAGSDRNLRAVAKADVPVIERHLQAARALGR